MKWTRRPELAILEWVDWFDHRRVFCESGRIPPAEHEHRYDVQTESDHEVETHTGACVKAGEVQSRHRRDHWHEEARMQAQDDGYAVIPFSAGRRLIADALSLGRSKHNIHGLLEVDVTKARKRIHEYEAETGTGSSFTAFVIACLGRAVDSNRLVHALRGRRNQLVVFDDVDVNTTVEIDMEGQRIPILHIVRAVNRRPYADLSREIQQVQAKGATSQAALKGRSTFMTIMPSSVRRLFFKLVSKWPQAEKKHAGTVLLTSVGMFGSGGGWGIPFIKHTLAVTLGGIAEKPVVVDGQIAIREMMSMTVSFDHDIVDGAPAARFADHFKNLIESGYGLANGHTAGT